MGHDIVKANNRDPVALGQVLAQSGYFSDARQAAQAAVKVMAGEELGLGPVASMTGIHVVNGKVTVGANLMAALVRNHRDYDYQVTEHTDQVCAIEFTYKDKPAGTSTFSMEDAQRAGLLKNPTWKAYPKAMLYARAMSQGVRWYCPNVASGSPLYTPDELGAEVKYDEGGDIVAVRVDEPVVTITTAPPVIEPVAQAPEQPADDGEVFDPMAVIQALKDQFGATVVKAAFGARGIEKFNDLTPEKAESIREQLALDTEGAAA